MSLWADIDSYLATALQTELGTGGLYSTLLVKQVLVDDLMGPEDAAQLANYPVVLVRSYHATQAPGAHGGGVVNVENTYEYMLVSIAVSDGVRQAKRDAQELRRRLREFLRTRLSLGGLTSSDGEQVRRVIWKESRLEVWQKPDGNNLFLSVAGLSFDILST